MRKRKNWIVALMVIAPAGLLAATLLAVENDNKPAGPPALKIDRSAPLLLLDEPAPKTPVKPGGKMADNSACYVCHTNYQEESMVTSHAKEKVGCIDCHGQSLDHRNDEDNITPPDIMFPAAKIDKSCAKCHEEHDVAPSKVISKWQERCPAKTDPKDIICTDCHGEHRLKMRTVRWDKETRQLISRTSDAGSKKTGQ